MSVLFPLLKSVPLSKITKYIKVKRQSTEKFTRMATEGQLF
jgi:hypothetical protein